MPDSEQPQAAAESTPPPALEVEVAPGERIKMSVDEARRYARDGFNMAERERQIEIKHAGLRLAENERAFLDNLRTQARRDPAVAQVVDDLVAGRITASQAREQVSAPAASQAKGDQVVVGASDAPQIQEIRRELAGLRTELGREREANRAQSQRAGMESAIKNNPTLAQKPAMQKLVLNDMMVRAAANPTLSYDQIAAIQASEMRESFTADYAQQYAAKKDAQQAQSVPANVGSSGTNLAPQEKSKEPFRELLVGGIGKRAKEAARAAGIKMANTIVHAPNP